MNVAIIGSGNVAAVLGRVISASNHKIIHIASRNEMHAATLAAEFKVPSSDYSGINNTDADLYIIAINDGAIADCASSFSLKDKLVVHTAGSVSKNVLKGISSNYGILYPLQSLRKEMKHLPCIPFLIDGSSEPVIKVLKEFAGSISNNVQLCNDDQRLKLHASAVVVSNFPNHLYALAEQFCIKENIPFDLLKPLITETGQRIAELSPSQVQTGPAIRKDIHTLDKHLKLFNEYPKLKYLYLKMTDSIMHES